MDEDNLMSKYIRTMLENTCREAGEVIKECQKNLLVKKKKLSYKYDLLSNADLASEKLILNKLINKFPNIPIISEETCPNKDICSDTYFTVDPIDATINFINGLPYWAIQIACVFNNDTIASAIYFPAFNNMYSADNEGSYLNNKRIYVSNKNLEDGLYSIEGPDRIIGRKNLIEDGYIHLRELYATCSSFSYVADGTFVSSVYNYKYCWDWMPGEFLVRKAGGVSLLDTKNNKYFVGNNNKNLEIFSKYFY